jgi:U3 small nucleolar RNA-associated protein MPP10
VLIKSYLLNKAQAQYNDFFAPPRKIPKSKGTTSAAPSQSAPRTAKVKFHDQVRVKEIEAANRGRSAKDLKLQSLSSLWDQGDVIDDEEEEGEENGDDDEESEEDIELDEEDLDFMGPPKKSGKKRQARDDENELSDEIEEPEGRDTIERFKDDLFGEEEEEMSSGFITNFATNLKNMNHSSGTNNP